MEMCSSLAGALCAAPASATQITLSPIASFMRGGICLATTAYSRAILIWTPLHLRFQPFAKGWKLECVTQLSFEFAVRDSFIRDAALAHTHVSFQLTGPVLGVCGKGRHRLAERCREPAEKVNLRDWLIVYSVV